jgi:hypothetical protein
MAKAISFVQERQTTPVCFLLLHFQLNFGLSRLDKAQILCRSPRNINHGLITWFHPIVNGDDNTLSVIKICDPDFGSVGKRFVRRSEFVLVVNRAAGGLLALELIVVEVGDTFFGGLSGRDPKIPHGRKTYDGDYDAKLLRRENFHLELLSF